MSADSAYENLLRGDADNFVLTVIVVADRQGRTPYDVAHEALADSLARLTETGAIGSDAE